MPFVLFQAPFPDAPFSKRLDSPSREALTEFLAESRALCLKKMFSYAPLDLKGLEAVAEPYARKVTSVESLALAFKEIKPSELEARMRPFVLVKEKSGEAPELPEKKKGDAVDFAWAFFSRNLFEKIFPQRKTASNKCEGTQLILAADLPGWRIVKKTDLAKAEPKEVLACLAGVFAALEKKFWENACATPVDFVDFIQKTFSEIPERKSFARISQAIEAAKAGENSLPASGSPSLLKELLYEKALERTGFPPFVSTQAVSEVYPELKIPKPRGRLKKN